MSHAETDADATRAAVRAAWEANAAFWDERMGEGNAFVERLLWPAITRLLALAPDERMLDVGCGNGLTSRRLAAAGARVVAFDSAAAMIAHARGRTAPGAPIAYRQLDGTDEAALLALGAGTFDGAIANMVLMDMAEVAPLFRALARLLRPGGRFVFSVAHPAFNHTGAVMLAEQEDRGGEPVRRYGVRVMGYLDPTVTRGFAIEGQPEPQLYFHRPLTALLAPAFEAGLVLDGLEEPAFTEGDRNASLGPTWTNLAQIPPVLVARLRRAGGPA